MLMGKRKPHSPASQPRGAYRPTGEALESRIAPAQINLANVDTDAVGLGPLGVKEIGSIPNGGAGFRTAQLGDVNGDGFDDYLIGAPSVVLTGDLVTGLPTSIDLGGGASSRAFLVFGSRQVGGPSGGGNDYLNIPAGQGLRFGDLGQLGNINQTSPVNNLAGYAFDGVTFFNSTNVLAQLGASVSAAGDVNGDGLDDILIGAPGANDDTQAPPLGSNVNEIPLAPAGANAGTGRTYLIYGSPALASRTTPLIDLDRPQDSPDLRIVTFINGDTGQIGGRTGSAVAGVGDVITDGIPDIAIGAPAASPTGVGNSGAVYVVSGSLLQAARTTTIRLQRVGQPGGNPGVLFVGERSGDQAGAALAPAGNFDGDTNGPNSVDDFLIGAPAQPLFPVGLPATGPGRAYLVLGDPNLDATSVIIPTGANPAVGPTATSLTRISAGANPPAGSAALPILGITFTGALVGDRTGFAVSSAGNFNNDTDPTTGLDLDDILIGSPGFDAPTTGFNAGRVNFIYGLPRAALAPYLNTSPPPVPLTEPVALAPDVAGPLASAEFHGAQPGALAGYSLAATGRITTIAPPTNLNPDPFNEFLIGSPGFNNLSGIAYLIPGRAAALPNGPTVLDQIAIQATLGAAVFTLNPPTPPTTPNFLGGSVAGRFPGIPGEQNQRVPPTQNPTAQIDGDNLADAIIGAPGVSFPTPGDPTGNTRFLAGDPFAIEGALLALPSPAGGGPVPGQITTTIGVEQPNPPFVVSATTPATLQIFVFSNNTITPPFRPFDEIDETTIVVNGVAFPNAAIDPTTPADLNNDGIPDAIVTISPRTALGLTTATTTLTIEGRTLPGAANDDVPFSGSATIRVVGGGTGGGGLGTALPLSFSARLFARPNAEVPRFGERFVPQRHVLSKLRYKPLTVRRAYRQFLPTDGFGRRFRNFFRPEDQQLGSRNKDTQYGVTTLGRDVFTRGRFRAGQIRFPRIDHGQPTIPPT